MSLSARQLLPRYAAVAGLKLETTADQAEDLAEFQARLPNDWGVYHIVGGKVDLPPALIAALHQREASGSFHRYLAQGDPLGAPAVNDPKGQPVRQIGEWPLAAQDALTQPQQLDAQADLGITFETTDLAALLAYAEVWNGEGYALHEPPIPDPYCLAGTNGYEGGKYVADHVFSPTAHDQQIGVLPMLWFAQKRFPVE